MGYPRGFGLTGPICELWGYTIRMGYVIFAVFVIAMIAGLVRLVDSRRYARMSDAEFEAEARRGSAIGSAMLEIQNVVDPS